MGGWYCGKVDTLDVDDEGGAGFLCDWVVLMSRRFLSRTLAISIVMPQKSGTRCEHVWWHVREHSTCQSHRSTHCTPYKERPVIRPRRT